MSIGFIYIIYDYHTFATAFFFCFLCRSLCSITSNRRTNLSYTHCTQNAIAIKSRCIEIDMETRRESVYVCAALRWFSCSSLRSILNQFCSTLISAFIVSMRHNARNWIEARQGESRKKSTTNYCKYRTEKRMAIRQKEWVENIQQILIKLNKTFPIHLNCFATLMFCVIFCCCGFSIHHYTVCILAVMHINPKSKTMNLFRFQRDSKLVFFSARVSFSLVLLHT